MFSFASELQMLEFASSLQPTKRILEIKCWSSQAHSNLRNEFWRLNVGVRKLTPTYET